jgi:hypothetical protein
MSYAVKICVLFRCDNNDALAKIAKNHLNSYGLVVPPGNEWPNDSNQPELVAAGLSIYDFDDWHSLCFLTDMARRTGYNPGRNGGMCCWGAITNAGIPEVFAEELKDFWFDIMKDEDVHCLDRIIILYEREQEYSAGAIEVCCKNLKGKGRLKENMILKETPKLSIAWSTLEDY